MARKMIRADEWLFGRFKRRFTKRQWVALFGGNPVLFGGPTDTTAPTVTITSSESSPSFANPIPLTFTLSEVATDFAVGDITVGAGGSIGNFAGSGTSYTADLTITGALATVTVDVAANAFHDAAGNGNTAATQFSITSGLALKDEFITDDAAPLSSPRTSEPGPGTLTATETDGSFSISGTKLVWTGQATPVYGDLRLSSQEMTRAAGICYYAKKFKPTSGNTAAMGFDANTAGEPNLLGIRFDFLVFRPGFGGNQPANVRSYALNNEYDVALVFTAARGYMYVRGGGFSRWTLLWTQAVAATTLYAALAPQDMAGSMDALEVVKLANTSFQTDFGAATSYTASPTDGQVVTCAADALIEFSWTPASSEVLTLLYRRTDDNNTLKLVCDEAADKVYLYKREASTDTELGGTGGIATTFNAGTKYRIVLTADGSLLHVHVDGTRKQFTTSTYNVLVGGVKVSGFATGETLVCYPIDGSTLLAEVNSPTKTFLVIGDSKSTSTGYPDDLVTLINVEPGVFCANTLPQLDVGGATVAITKAAIDANLATRGDSPTWVLINLGANDVASLPAEADWKSNLTYILDALHVKYPATKVYIMRPWKRAEAADCNSLATWIGDVVTSRSTFAYLGPDERVFLENGDDGATYTDDGIHPNAAGYALTAAQWKTTLGL